MMIPIPLISLLRPLRQRKLAVKGVSQCARVPLVNPATLPRKRAGIDLALAQRATLEFCGSTAHVFHESFQGRKQKM